MASAINNTAIAPTKDGVKRLANRVRQFGRDSLFSETVCAATLVQRNGGTSTSRSYRAKRSCSAVSAAKLSEQSTHALKCASTCSRSCGANSPSRYSSKNSRQTSHFITNSSIRTDLLSHLRAGAVQISL